MVFLTGAEEIATAAHAARELAAALPAELPALEVVALHAALPADEQARALAPAPAGSRKLILSTNVAETSLTIDGVRAVVDPGYAKEKSFVRERGMEVVKADNGLRANLQPAIQNVAGVEAAGIGVELFHVLVRKPLRVAECAHGDDAVQSLGEVREDGASCRRVQPLDGARGTDEVGLDSPIDEGERRRRRKSVSYTHLTLPTILLV